MELEQIFGTGGETAGKVDRIIAITERIEKIDRAISQIKYNDELFMEVPEVVKTLAAAKEAAVAELKTL